MFTLPVGGYATFLAFKLGMNLPVACRGLGRHIGMGYNYFKVVVKLLAPSSETPAEIVEVFRKTD